CRRPVGAALHLPDRRLDGLRRRRGACVGGPVDTAPPVGAKPTSAPPPSGRCPGPASCTEIRLDTSRKVAVVAIRNPVFLLRILFALASCCGFVYTKPIVTLRPWRIRAPMTPIQFFIVRTYAIRRLRCLAARPPSLRRLRRNACDQTKPRIAY